MSYKILVPPAIRDKIKTFEIDLYDLILQELEKLGEHPELGEKAMAGVFAGSMRYNFKIFRPPLKIQFSVTYQFLPNEQEILIIKILHTVGNPPQNNHWPTKPS